MDQDSSDHANSAEHASELTQAAAESSDAGERLWRLQWAQAFKRLSDIGKPKHGDDGDDPNSPR